MYKQDTHHTVCDRKNYNPLMVSFVDIVHPIVEQEHVIPNNVFYSYAVLFLLSIFQTFTGEKTMQQSSLYHNHVFLKGIVHNFFFYRSNLIFWIVMGCGIADLGRRGL